MLEQKATACRADHLTRDVDVWADEFYANMEEWSKKYGVEAQLEWDKEMASLWNHPLWGTF